MKLSSMTSLLLVIGSMPIGDMVEAFPAIWEDVSEVVSELENSSLSKTDKFEVAALATKEIIDEHFDWVPGWRDMSERVRDLIIGALVELALICVRAKDRSVSGTGALDAYGVPKSLARLKRAIRLRTMSVQ